MDRFWTRLGATFFFTGMFPVAPATFASAVTLALWWVAPPVSWWVQLVLILAVTAIGVRLSSAGEDLFGHDGKPIVIDEVAGCLITVFALPHTWQIAAAGFLLFRIFDVVKPPPAYQFQSFPRGWGVMADDLMAGVYSLIVLRVIAHFWPGTLGLI